MRSPTHQATAATRSRERSSDGSIGDDPTMQPLCPTRRLRLALPVKSVGTALRLLYPTKRVEIADQADTVVQFPDDSSQLPHSFAARFALGLRLQVGDPRDNGVSLRDQHVFGRLGLRRKCS